MKISDKIKPVWDTITKSLDLKKKYIKIEDINRYMFVSDCQIELNEDVISYKLTGNMLDMYDPTIPSFSFQGGSMTYNFSLKNLLEGRELDCIEEITRREFEDLLDSAIRCWKEKSNIL